MDSFLNAVGIQRVLHRDLCERFQRNFAQRGNFLRHIAHVRRLIPAAADGFGRKVRAVRLNQDAVKRHIHRGFLQFRRFLEGHRPRKADEVPQFQVLLRNLLAAGKAVDDAAGQMLPVALHDVQHVLMRVPDVVRHGQRQFPRQLHLRFADRHLRFAR